jgi:hypothetical protein
MMAERGCVGTSRLQVLRSLLHDVAKGAQRCPHLFIRTALASSTIEFISFRFHCQSSLLPTPDRSCTTTNQTRTMAPIKLT